MKALGQEEAAPGIWMMDAPRPRWARTTCSVEIAKTAICGTDMHIYKWDEWAQKTIPVPMAVGHEYCGRIVEMGSEVRGFNVGDRVSAKGTSPAAIAVTAVPAGATSAATRWGWA